MEETKRMRLQNLRIVDEAALFDRSRGHFHSEQPVAGLGAGKHVADRADSADARHQARHLVKGASFTELFKAAEFGDVKLRRTHFTGVVDVDRNLGVALDASDRTDENPLAHYPNLSPAVEGVRPSSRSIRNAWMVSAEGGQPGK